VEGAVCFQEGVVEEEGVWIQEEEEEEGAWIQAEGVAVEAICLLI